MANSNFHVSHFSLISSISKMKKIEPPPPHQNHFSSTSVKTRRKYSFLLRRSLNFTSFSNIGHHMLAVFVLSCFLSTFMLTLAIENTQDIDLHPLIVLAESQDQTNSYQDYVEAQPLKQLFPSSSSAKIKREGRQYNGYDDNENQQKSAAESRQQSPQELVSGNHFLQNYNGNSN